MSKRFLRSMAQPFDQDQTGISLWTLEDIEERQRAQQDLANKDTGNMDVDGAPNFGEVDPFAGLEVRLSHL
jgi:DNA excision repair protein ERCC-2